MIFSSVFVRMSFRWFVMVGKDVMPMSHQLWLGMSCRNKISREQSNFTLIITMYTRIYLLSQALQENKTENCLGKQARGNKKVKFGFWGFYAILQFTTNFSKLNNEPLFVFLQGRRRPSCDVPKPSMNLFYTFGRGPRLMLTLFSNFHNNCF